MEFRTVHFSIQNFLRKNVVWKDVKSNLMLVFFIHVCTFAYFRATIHTSKQKGISTKREREMGDPISQIEKHNLRKGRGGRDCDEMWWDFQFDIHLPPSSSCCAYSALYCTVVVSEENPLTLSPSSCLMEQKEQLWHYNGCHRISFPAQFIATTNNNAASILLRILTYYYYYMYYQSLMGQ